MPYTHNDAGRTIDSGLSHERPDNRPVQPYQLNTIPMGGRDDADRYFAWLDSQVDVETANAIASLAFNPGRKD